MIVNVSLHLCDRIDFVLSAHETSIFFITSDEIINRKTILSIEFSKAAISIDRFLSVRLCVRLNQSEKCVGVEHQKISY